MGTLDQYLASQSKPKKTHVDISDPPKTFKVKLEAKKMKLRRQVAT